MLEQINQDITAAIKEVGAEDMKAMGMVIKTVSSKVGASADMGVVSKIVKEKLSN